MACTLVHRYPKLVLGLGEIAGAKIPSHDLAVATSNEHQLPSRPPLAGDGTVRFLRDGVSAFFAQVEVQRKHDEDKYATLRAYHGSEVSKAQAGGHMIVVSPKSAEAEKFRRSEIDRGAEYAYRASYLSSKDLEPLAEDGRPFEERCFAIGMTDFSRGVPPAARAMLHEAADRDATIANLFFRAIFEEVPDMTMVRDVLEPDLLKKLRQLESFRNYEDDLRAELKESIDTEAAAKAKADDLMQFFYLRGDRPSDFALDQISQCTDIAQLNLWLRKAYTGETAAEIFPEA